MKKFMFMLFILSGIWFTSCQKEENAGLAPAEESTTSADLESMVTSAAARYAVVSDSVTIGKCKGKLTEVAAADLAASVTAYINTTYPNAEIKYAAKDSEGKMVVAIALADGTLKGLLFNADGTFKEELKQHIKKARLTRVEISTLPAAITVYIANTNAGAEIKEAATNADREYYVGILIDSTIKVLLFNADGTFNKELVQAIKKHKRH